MGQDADIMVRSYFFPGFFLKKNKKNKKLTISLLTLGQKTPYKSFQRIAVAVPEKACLNDEERNLSTT